MHTQTHTSYTLLSLKPHKSHAYTHTHTHNRHSITDNLPSFLSAGSAAETSTMQIKIKRSLFLPQSMDTIIMSVGGGKDPRV